MYTSADYHNFKNAAMKFLKEQENIFLRQDFHKKVRPNCAHDKVCNRTQVLHTQSFSAEKRVLSKANETSYFSKNPKIS